MKNRRWVIATGILLPAIIATAVLARWSALQDQKSFMPVFDRETTEVAGWADSETGEISWNRTYSPLSHETREMLREEDRKRWEWKGTQMSPSKNAKGDDLPLQQEICDLFASLDPQISHHKNVFKCLSHAEISCTGWYGTLENVSRQGNGWLVDLRVSPYLASTLGNHTSTPDFWIETWKYEERQLHFVRGRHDVKPVVSFHIE